MAIFVSLDLEYILNWTLQFINVIFLFILPSLASVKIFGDVYQFMMCVCQGEGFFFFLANSI